MESVTAPAVAARPREFVGVRGPDAASFLQRLVSNDVEALAGGESCDALLLTPKARVVAPLRVLRRSTEDFLLLTEVGLGDVVLRQLVRARFAAKVDLARERHDAFVLFASEPPAGAVAAYAADYGEPAWEVVAGEAPADADVVDEAALELRRIEACRPGWGSEIDERVLPAEAGLDSTAISFTKGCYPGQEPVARLHYRGRPNRRLQRLELDVPERPAYDAELRSEGKAVGRVTSVARRPDGSWVGLGYVRREVADEAVLEVEGGGVARVRPAVRPA